MGLFSIFKTSQGDVSEFLSRDAIILDVRTRAEYAEGAPANSMNIPLNELAQRIAEIKKQGRPVITCCRSGMRSGQASSMLSQQGIEAMNGGPWQNVASHQ